ncbi:hypothetical protein [Bradyrhizobium sp. LHD-71]|uniref:hypothetical protein n=1 Tax=Bradyrhizobium sp. LHD-71 TaxID=3072141 RepID=UPI00280D1D29|nr:hypothetical protein [Bradyrhizobium sp. LHD-71]MDQ8729859.1 hypothetical protein [Bradyrhizobium sp. LHD-71]
MDPLTFIHVLLSLIGILSGFVVLAGMFDSRRLESWTAIFLITTVATSVTGFVFPFTKLLPSHIFGIISLAVLAIAAAARYSFRLKDAWRWIYAVTALVALYLNVFVLVVQAFLKVPGLTALAPTQSEPPFLVAQTVVLAFFVYAGTRAIMRFRPSTMVAN